MTVVRVRVRVRVAVAGLVVLVLLVAGALAARAPEARAVVTQPTGNEAVVSVRAGGDRTGVSSVAGLPGVVLQLFRATNGASPVTEAWGTCTSDADGDCSFVVPEAQRGSSGSCTGAGAGVNCGARFYVRQVGAPAGFFTNPVLSTTTTGASGVARPYEFQTPALYAGQTITSGQPGGTGTFMVSQTSTLPTASGGVWQQSRTNPPLPQVCGLDVALILDLSGSVGANLPDLKGAADTFVDALTGTPSRLSLFSFAALSPAAGATANYPEHRPVSTTADAAAFKSLYAGWTVGGGTNWDRGIAAAAEATQAYDLAILITDGNPTYYSDPTQGNGSATRFRETENGIFSANALKVRGTRLLAVGVGAGVSDDSAALNLQSVSGTEEYVGGNVATADFFRTGFEEAGAALQELVFSKCAPSLSVVKAIVPPGGGVADAAPAGAGWAFTADAAPAVGGLPGTQVTPGDGTGAVNFPVSFTGSTSITVTEAQQPGYTLLPQAGANAVCTARSPDAPDGVAVPVTNVDDPDDPGFTFPMVSNSAVSCVVYNQAPVPPASVVVDKTWVVNGQTVAQGAQPSDITADLWLTTPDQPDPARSGWGVTTDLSLGDDVGLAEVVSFGSRDLCTLDSAVVTSVNGDPVGDAFPSEVRAAGADREVPPSGPFYDLTLTVPLTTVAVTNTVTCPTELSLTKTALGGTTPPTAWDLTATGPGGTELSGPTGSGGVTDVAVTPGATYVIAESGGDPWFAQVDQRGADAVPGSTGSAFCRVLSADGTLLGDVINGLNGSVVPALGQRTTCEVVNFTARLALRKVVQNADGQPAPPDAWQLTATPTGPDVPAGLGPVTVDGTSAPLGDVFFVRPGTPYTLTESAAPDAPAGYTLSGVECALGPSPREAPVVTVEQLSSIICTFTNVADPSTWTVEKSSDPGSGSTVRPGDVVTYTVTATDLGTGAARPTDVVVVDDLAGVLGGGTLVEGSVTAGTGTAAVSGSSLTWAIPLLDGTATLTYQVVVRDDADAATLTNVVVADGAEPCPPENPECRTTTHVTPPLPLVPGDPGSAGGAGVSGLPVTGTDVALLLLVAAVLIGAGAAGVRARRARMARGSGGVAAG
ncbi:hypothetical protein [Cellulomonas sp. Y8]|uniref:DUF7927 domain-containing protein n=1 Tax=Cellulomonas sp. Y8 TaxID=2591145 RepID=UPI003D75F45E